MNNGLKRILTASVMLIILAGTVILENQGFNAVKFLIPAVVFGMILEYTVCLLKSKKSKKKEKSNPVLFTLFFILLISMLVSGYFLGQKPWIILLLLLIIAAADTGAWFFGKMFGHDKMWEHLSANKTWVGQIAGIICGTIMAVLYGLLGTDTFMPQLLWIGISVALLSQYGDLTASLVKRTLGIKDFSNVLPGHGGLLDRFDGWIYVLPLVWLVTM